MMRYSSKGVLPRPSIVRTKGCGARLKNDGWDTRVMGKRVPLFAYAQGTILDCVCRVTAQATA